MKNWLPDVPAGSLWVLAIATVYFVYLQVGRRLLADRVAGAAEAVGERVAGLDDERAARRVARDAVEGQAVVEAALDERGERRRGLRRLVDVQRDRERPAVRLHRDGRGPGEAARRPLLVRLAGAGAADPGRACSPRGASRRP